MNTNNSNNENQGNVPAKIYRSVFSIFRSSVDVKNNSPATTSLHCPEPITDRPQITSRELLLQACGCCGLISSYHNDNSKFICRQCCTMNHIIFPENSMNTYQMTSALNGAKMPTPCISMTSAKASVPPILSNSASADGCQGPEPISYCKIKEISNLCHLKTEALSPKDGHLIRKAYEPLCTILYESTSSQACLNKSFTLRQTPNRPHYSSSNLNRGEIHAFFNLLAQLPTKKPLYNALKGAIHSLQQCISIQIDDPNNLRYLLIFLEIPYLKWGVINYSSPPTTMVQVPEIRKLLYEVLQRTLGVLARSLSRKAKGYFCSWFSKLPASAFINQVDMINQFISFQLRNFYNTRQRKLHSPGIELVHNESNSTEKMNSIKSEKESQKTITIYQYGTDWNLESALLVLLIYVRALPYVRPTVPFSTFYNLMMDFVDVKLDFDSWQSRQNVCKHRSVAGNSSLSEPEVQVIIDYIHESQRSGNYLYMDSAYFFVCQYPFLISLGAKIHILEHEAKSKMVRKVEEAFVDSLDRRTVIDINFTVRVRRSYIVQDSLRCIELNPNNLHKTLKVQFLDEPGIDIGGLKKEWFFLLTRSLFGPEAGLFVEIMESNFVWFNLTPSENLNMYSLFGTVLGLAIYNSTILDLHFPKLFYKLLLGKKLGFEDFKELYPEVAHNLVALRHVDRLEDLCLTFNVNYRDIFGKVYSRELIAGGSSKVVNKRNLNEYVEKYSSFYMEDGIERQCRLFLDGFRRVLGGNALSIFEVEEIEALLCGSHEKKLDLGVLKSVTEYNGWDSREIAEDSNIIQWFWEYMEAQPFSIHCKFLQFISGSDRIPATGLQNLSFKITYLRNAKGGRHRLPVAHTCFNELVLYNYTSRELMVSKLETAIFESSGFGLK